MAWDETSERRPAGVRGWTLVIDLHERKGVVLWLDEHLAIGNAGEVIVEAQRVRMVGIGAYSQRRTATRRLHDSVGVTDPRQLRRPTPLAG